MQYYVDVSTGSVHSYQYFVSQEYHRLVNKTSKLTKMHVVDQESSEIIKRVLTTLHKMAVGNISKLISQGRLMEAE